jgi:ketosteroid isomerase-like protein
MALKDEIQAAQNSLAQAIAARDVEGAVALYTADARMMPHGAPTCTDHAAIGGFFRGAFDNGIVAARFTTDEVEGDAAQATETGRYELFAGPPNGEQVLAASGRYLVVWRKVNGAWRIHRDMFNS